MTQIEPYSRLAGVYDEIVIDPCHGRWASFLHELWRADAAGVGSVLDLCCGTGLLAGELVDRGYRVVGVDASEAMLALARERLGPEAALSRMTLPDLAVAGVFDAAVCTFDSLNYLTPEELRLTMGAVARCLRPAGWFVFDLHTDAMMDFAIANPIVAGQAAGNDFVISTVVDCGARTCDTRIELTQARARGFLRRAAPAVLPRGCGGPCGPRRRGLRGHRGRGGVHTRAGGRLDPARDLDRTTRIDVTGTVPEARLDDFGSGLAPVTEGWFVVNVRDAEWWSTGWCGWDCAFENETQKVEFAQVGIRLRVLEPGQPGGMYHAESDQEAFLVLSGECRLLVEGEERLLRQWDFFHCPAWTEHIVVGAGDGRSVILMAGARSADAQGLYPVSELAARYGASAEHETSDPQEVYARFELWQRGRPSFWDRLPWA